MQPNKTMQTDVAFDHAADAERYSAFSSCLACFWSLFISLVVFYL